MGERTIKFFKDLINTLDSYAFKIGSINLSAWGIIKGIIAIAILYWTVGISTRFFKARFKNSKSLTNTQKVLYLKLIYILLITVAILIGLNVVGIDLTAIAIFSSAVGIGIGFGLQKIISNFISGIIILTDKSIQPGDIIALGDTYGEVTNLEARYVSVVTRDGKAHLIPNELFITQKVENWSYGNSELRLRIPVGVAYGSDMKLVEKLLVEAALEHPRVLRDPIPKALIREFAESQVNFELRAWIDDPANGIRQPQSDIYFLVWNKFKENHIEMPFPQREVRFRSTAVSKDRDSRPDERLPQN